MTIKSVYESQEDILNAITHLHCADGFECDVTYGNGGFYKSRPRPKHCFDIEPLHDFVETASSDNIPLSDSCIGNIVFDPPFLTYIKAGREHNSIMGKRFSGYWRYEELEAHYRGTAKEAYRVLKKGGVFIVKCQDIIHNHKLHPTHINMANWCSEIGFKMLDLYILSAKHRMPVNKKGKQQHARIYHSYFILFRK